MSEQIVPQDTVNVIYRADISTLAKMITEKMFEETDLMVKSADRFIEQVEKTDIKNQDDYNNAVILQSNIKGKISDVKKVCNEFSDKLNVLHKAATGERSLILQPLENAGSTIAGKLQKWELEKLAEQRRLEEEARRKAAEEEEREKRRIEKQQEKAAAKGDEEKFEELEQKKREVYVPPVEPVVFSGRTETAGVKRSAKPDIVVSIQNIKLICRAVADGKLPISVIKEVSCTAAKKHFKDFGTTPKEAAEMGFVITDAVASRNTPKK